ncbi:MAG: TetR/AcrR family transcriptional regulator [Acidobacteria bacterium]|nr:TetR/AcrR family transcriptional regulator [Acidobacteriota bacterium]
MPKSKKSRELSSREQKRRRILRAAIDVFANKGYFAARMTDIADAANVADGTLYLYFDGKEHLLLSVFDDALERFIDQLKQEMERLDDPLAKLKVMVRLHLEALGRDRALAHVLQIETRHSRKFMRLLSRGKLGEYLSLLNDIVKEGQDLGSFRRDVNTGLATNVIFGAVDELVNRWLLADEPGDLTQYQGPLLKMLFQGIVPCEFHEGAAG